VSPEFEQVVGCADEIPLAVDGALAAAVEAATTPSVFDLSEDRFDALAAQTVQSLATFGRQFFHAPLGGLQFGRAVA
jgi:hypothetical protein